MRSLHGTNRSRGGMAPLCDLKPIPCHAASLKQPGSREKKFGNRSLTPYPYPVP
jgi:hypothetical protein